MVPTGSKSGSLLLFGMDMSKQKTQMNLGITDEPEAAPMPAGKDEMNFAEFPIALLTDKVPKGQRFIKFEDQVYDEKRKRVITRRRIIEGSEEYGLPTATDDLVILALIQLSKQKGKGDFTSRAVEFTRLELIRLLGWTNEGKNYDRIKLSLLRIQSVNYVYDNAWWDILQKTWTTKAFHILDNVEINDSRTSGGQDGLFSSRITWNEVVFESFQAGFLRDIDFKLCMRLKHPTALRMYRFLGKRFWVRPEWAGDLKVFAHDHMGLGRNYEGGTQIARKLKPAIEELEQEGFLEPLGESERFVKKGRAWSIRFIPKQTDIQAIPPAPPLPLDPPPGANAKSADLVAELASRGVTRKTAGELVGQHPHESIQCKIDVLDWMVATRDKRVGKSPSGYLVKSIRDDYAMPKGFVPRAERERLAKAQQEASEAAVSERAKAARADRLAEQAQAHLKSRTPEQYAALEADAIAQASEETRQSLKKPHMKSYRETQIFVLIREHLVHLVESGQLVLESA